VRLIASAFASSAAPASPIWLPLRSSCAEQRVTCTAWSNGCRIQRQRVSLAPPHCACTVPRHADCSQRVVGRQCLRKLSSTSITDLVANENELRRAERSMHSVGQWASHPAPVHALLRPVKHAPCHATRTRISVSLAASAFASSATPASPIWRPLRSSCAEQSGAGPVGAAAACHPFPSRPRPAAQPPRATHRMQLRSSDSLRSPLAGSSSQRTRRTDHGGYARSQRSHGVGYHGL